MGCYSGQHQAHCKSFVVLNAIRTETAIHPPIHPLISDADMAARAHHATRRNLGVGVSECAWLGELAGREPVGRE